METEKENAIAGMTKNQKRELFNYIKMLNKVQHIIVDALKKWSMKPPEDRKKGKVLLFMVTVAAYRKGFEDGQKGK